MPERQRIREREREEREREKKEHTGMSEVQTMKSTPLVGLASSLTG